MKFLNPDFGFAVGNGRVARTTDGGDTWEIVHEDHTYIQFYSVSFFDDLNGFVVGSRGEILRTNDGGLSWTRLTQSSIPPAALRIDDVYFLDNLNGIAAGEGEGGGVIYRTSDGGINWSLEDVGATPIFRRIGFFDENTGVAVGRYGIIRRTNNRGETWANPQLNQATSQLFDVHIVDDAFGCAVGETNIVITTDAGLTWQKQDYTGSWLFGVHFLNREKGFAVGNGGRVYGTVDGGATWDHVATIEPPRILRRVTFADSLNGVVVGDLGTVGRTTDGGLTWSGVELPEPYENSLFAVSFINSTTGYAGGLGGIILKTTDKGATWVRKNSKTHQSILGMHFLSETQGAMTGTFGQLLRTESLNTPVFHTNKSTVTFDDVQIGTMEQRNVIIYNLGNALLSIESIFATDTNFSVSHNSAAIFPGDSISLIIEFSPSKTGLYESDVIFEHNSISSPDTVKIIADAITSVAGEKNNLPTEFKLYQNYPNPFNPSTSIKFDIPHYAMVEISVYTILGQKIAVLLNKELAAGYHSVVWDASRLSSGIYFFHLKADNQTFVKKAILLK
ncbi:hypothetical protein ASZ90_005446 [hydrocarbon metagenome]|uniref:Secretion system C-terminal sorting domain-containing protein n=1 Tax=hydrocarbon metagenome TaxID=938273 RepID=A0A0W8FV50_9ZZZZ